MSFDYKTIDPNKLKRDPIQLSHVNFIERKIINLSEIYQPTIDDNPTRSVGKDQNKITHLQHIFAKNGIDYSLMPPVVNRINPRLDDSGNMLYYELVSGHHRMDAIRNNKYDSWVFDVYDGVSARDVRWTLQIYENNHPVSNPTTAKDATKTILTLINEKSQFIPVDENGSYEDSIKKYLEQYCSNMHFNTQYKVVKDCIRHLQDNDIMPYYDYYSYQKLDVIRYMENHTDLQIYGNYDNHYDQYGWTIQQGYESEYIMNAMKKYYNTGKISYFSLHTHTPTDESTLEERRQDMVENIHEYGSMIIECANYYKKHGKMPWYVMGFLPQDRRIEGQNYIFNE
jgi:hypothetical protein